MNRRRLLTVAGSASVVSLAGCLGSDEDETAEKDNDAASTTTSCSVSSLDDLSDGMPPEENGFTIKREATQGSVSLNLGADDFIIRRYEDEVGDIHDYIVAEFSSETAAEKGKIKLIKASDWTVGALVIDNYVFGADAQDAETAEQLHRLSPVLDDECISDHLVIANVENVE